MGQKITFNLPDLGEGLTEGEVAAWLVEPGGEVKLNQPFVEVETAKALVEVPSPYDGKLAEHHAEAGDTVDVGAPLASFEVEGAEPERPSGDERTPNLVGYGAKESAPKRRKRRRENGAAPAEPQEPAAQVEAAEPAAPVSPAVPVSPPGLSEAPSGPVLAKPPVRKLAKDLGVDLHQVAPTGPNGTVSRADVEAASAASAGRGSVRSAAPAQGGRPGLAPSGVEERIPIKGVRKLTAQNMVDSAFTAPHATVFLTCDVTGMMETVAELKGRREFADVKVSPLLLVAKAVLLACGRHPMINAAWDEPAGEIVVKHDVNLGIAAATPRGLVVPNIKAAQRFGLVELAEAMGELVDTAREGRTQPADMADGTFSITNVGVFGIDTGTPILPPGESAILAFGAVRPQPWVYEGEIAVRQVTTLGLSFDHRLIDGELGSRFLSDVGAFLEDPGATLLAWT